MGLSKGRRRWRFGIGGVLFGTLDRLVRLEEVSDTRVLSFEVLNRSRNIVFLLETRDLERILGLQYVSQLYELVRIF